MIRLIGNALHRDMCGTDVPCIGFCNWKHIAGIRTINSNRTDHSLYHLTHSLDREKLGDESITRSAPSHTEVRVIIFTKESEIYISVNLPIFILLDGRLISCSCI